MVRKFTAADSDRLPSEVSEHTSAARESDGISENVRSSERLAHAPVASTPVRILLVVCGTVAAGLGFLGVVLPFLPTTPFLLLAAFCYARSSQRLYDRLLATRGFGPLIREYRLHRTIPARAKVLAISMIGLTIGTTAVFATQTLPVKLLLCLIGLSVSIWIAAHPSAS